jgi:hypothetical protein
MLFQAARDITRFSASGRQFPANDRNAYAATATDILYA